MAMDPEALYLQLRQLVAEMPNLAGPGPITPEMHQWLGRCAALLVEQRKMDTDAAFALVDATGFTVCSDELTGPLREKLAYRLVAILHRALARAELHAPVGARGAFIPVGAAFDAFQVIGKVLNEATKDVLIVDAYMNAIVLTDFAPLAPEGVAIRLLTDSSSTKPETMRPPATRWVQQYGAARPLEVRLTAPRLLHDRLIIVDGGVRVWSLSQTLKDFAGRSPASVLRVADDIAAEKRHAYFQMWGSATPL
jgi:phospholipase D-like protein